MKVLHVPFHYYPDSVGGTEVYTASLARHLRSRGLDVQIAAPGHNAAHYVHDGIPVHRFGVTEAPGDLAVLYGGGDAEANRQFADILDRTRPDLVHLHAMSPAVSVEILREVKSRHIPVIFTCHIPGIICPRGTLLHYGRQVCDGAWTLHKCSSCALQARGLPIALSAPLGAIPANVGRAIAASGLRGPLATALRMTELQTKRRRSLTEFLSQVDHVIAVSDWMRQVLRINGVPPEKITVCRHGSTQPAEAAPPGLRPGNREALRVAFIGRVDATKGLHVLIEAIEQQPQLPIRLDVFPVIQDSRAYTERLRRRAMKDSRIQFLSPVPNDQIVARLRGYDVLAVPSLVVETGPLVVYDAFAAGIPVLGSNRGGISELVTHQKDGLLVEPGNARAWADALAILAGDRDLLERLRAGVPFPRTMAAVAGEMLDLYATLTPTASVSAGRVF
jgi:glycosyltransferase involved in cell wall biosynthesis